ncbi:hypothetical protein AGDE_05488 [Angomonas deanei]|uniref:Squalene/phytoene synthase, putative n=1 Tax=Angomonas deanei TaxID=59799 RepID=A0A7G2C0N8_9TRYP|nr:hypothetical protein AGDE_05488 [Angomonas deanei]CAD2212884.1 Squalene/phytoene synthase, putative [Angomonas deanei]|eukprot:EPY38441.1 hypothetical protein AGDE_05488 [Angomonas deanei]
MTGKLPSPRRPDSPPMPKRQPVSPSSTSSLPKRPVAPKATPISRQSSEKSDTPPPMSGARAEEASNYYKSVPQQELSKEEMWDRISKAKAQQETEEGVVLDSTEADYIRLEEEMKDHDLLHYRLGELAYPDEKMRRDYYAMCNLAMSLNKARWTMLEVHAQRGTKTTGAGMKVLFWKESINSIMEKKQMVKGQFMDSHPVLLPFASAVSHNPHMTKAFVRGFTDARLKVIQQPGNVKQLFDHFDKFYGYFFNSLLEVTHVKDESAEHIMLHIGRAIGLTNHCVMFWKKYAQIGFTMLPSDLCADHHVNLALLKNISLASRDPAVRYLLHEVMSIAKDEMLHAQKIAPHVSPKAWPIVMECMYPNYYLGFLQRREYNVSAMFADYNIENAGFVWYRLKKRWEWERTQSIEKLVDEAAPLPFIGTSFAHRGSSYKMSSTAKKSSAN